MSVPVGSHLSFGRLSGFVASSFSSRQIHGGFTCLDALQQDLGCTARGDEVEHGIVQKVAEAVAR